MTRDAYILFTGLTFTNCRVDEDHLPGREITQEMLYHMFASGLFESVTVKRAYDDMLRTYKGQDQMRFVQDRDRLEIRKLRAELETLKERAR